MIWIGREEYCPEKKYWYFAGPTKRKVKNHMGDGYSSDVECLCPTLFEKTTGIKLKPGEGPYKYELKRVEK